MAPWWSKSDVKTCIILSLIVHGILLCYGEFHDGFSTVKYTDVDYRIFNDAATAVIAGKSPYDRPTYRYTPLLAWILIPGQFMQFAKIWGKVLFCLVDVSVGYLLYEILRSQKVNTGKSIYCASAWFFNPMALVVSSRGNAESIMSALVLGTILLVLRKKSVLAGILYGFSVHFKIYPVIYAAPFYFSVGFTAMGKHGAKPKKFLHLLHNLLWPNINRLKFVLFAATGFLLPTFFSYTLYGNKYLDESFRYHLRRSDTKHNFSPYFYLMYLSAQQPQLAVMSLLAFVPQLIMVSLFAIRFNKPSDLPFCAFMQTYVFVTYNKVCTSQYFLWYLSILPLIIPKLKTSWHQSVVIFGFWISSQCVWLFAAYALEFHAANTFLHIWIASLFFFLSNVFVLKFFLTAYQST